MCINDKKLYIKVSNSILCLKSWSKAQRVGDKINQDFRPKKGLDGALARRIKCCYRFYSKQYILAV